MSYNSKGANSTLNNLHFQLLFKDDNKIRNFEIDPETIVLKDNQLSYVKNNNYRYYRINKINTSPETIQRVLNILNEHIIPYNIIIENNNINIFPRSHQNIVKNSFAFLEILGIVPFHEEKVFAEYSIEDYKDDLAKLWLRDEDYNLLNNIFLKLLNE